MTREECKKLLGENATDEQVTNLLNTIHAEVESKNNEINDLKSQLTSSTEKVEKLSGFEAELNAIKQSQMTETERFEEQKKQLQAEISATKKLSNSIKAKSILIGAGISNERADILVNKFVNDDEKITLDLANEFVAEFNSMKDVTAKSVREELTKVDVTPTASNVTNQAMTWDKFMSLSQDEQNKFQLEHSEEFNNL